MKKLVHIIAVAVIAVSPFALGSGASAASTCDVGYTGPDSQNNCTLVTKHTCEVVNDTTINIDGENVQFSSSGGGSSGGSTSGGSATSGTATNANGTTFGVSISNDNLAKVCNATTTTVVPAKPSETVTPPKKVTPQRTVKQTVSAPGRGAAPAALPNTSGDTTMPLVATLVGVLAGGTLLSRIGLSSLRRFNK